MSEEIVNKVAGAGIVQLDLKDFLSRGTIISLDLKDQLWNELVLKEKEFRDWVKNHDWQQYDNQIVCVFCSADAIIPSWAYMIVASELSGAKKIHFGNLAQAREEEFFENLQGWNVGDLKDKRVMVKGCSDIPNPEKAYLILTRKLVPVVKSLMFGEPCSAVPVFKRKN